MQNSNNNHLQTKLTTRIKTELERTIKRLYVNKELIAFMKAKIPINAKDGLAYLHYFKKLVQQVFRSPDPDHYKAFEDEYDAERTAIAEEQSFYNPVKWLNAEIEYLLSKEPATPDHIANEQLTMIEKAKEQLNKDWLTRAQVMQLLQISKSTLSRWISQGMHCHKKGRSIYFNLNDIDTFLRE